MKRFLQKIILFFFIYLGLSLLISFCLPYHWGNPWYSMKIRYLNEGQENAWNTYFFGSSRVHNQIDPAVFDLLVNNQEHREIRSFNLGAQGAFPPQSYFLFEKFLDSKHSDGVKYCFLELREMARIMPANRVPANHSYWLTVKELFFAFRCLLLDPTKVRPISIASFLDI